MQVSAWDCLCKISSMFTSLPLSFLINDNLFVLLSDYYQFFAKIPHFRKVLSLLVDGFCFLNHYLSFFVAQSSVYFNWNQNNSGIHVHFQVLIHIFQGINSQSSSLLVNNQEYLSTHKLTSQLVSIAWCSLAYKQPSQTEHRIFSLKNIQANICAVACKQAWRGLQITYIFCSCPYSELLDSCHLTLVLHHLDLFFLNMGSSIILHDIFGIIMCLRVLCFGYIWIVPKNWSHIHTNQAIQSFFLRFMISTDPVYLSLQILTCGIHSGFSWVGYRSLPLYQRLKTRDKFFNGCSSLIQAIPKAQLPLSLSLKRNGYLNKMNALLGFQKMENSSDSTSYMFKVLVDFLRPSKKPFLPGICVWNQVSSHGPTIPQIKMLQEALFLFHMGALNHLKKKKKINFITMKLFFFFFFLKFQDYSLCIFLLSQKTEGSISSLMEEQGPLICSNFLQIEHLKSLNLINAILVPTDAWELNFYVLGLFEIEFWKCCHYSSTFQLNWRVDIINSTLNTINHPKQMKFFSPSESHINTYHKNKDPFFLYQYLFLSSFFKRILTFFFLLIFILFNYKKRIRFLKLSYKFMHMKAAQKSHLVCMSSTFSMSSLFLFKILLPPSIPAQFSFCPTVFSTFHVVESLYIFEAVRLSYWGVDVIVWMESCGGFTNKGNYFWSFCLAKQKKAMTESDSRDGGKAVGKYTGSLRGLGLGSGGLRGRADAAAVWQRVGINCGKGMGIDGLQVYMTQIVLDIKKQDSSLESIKEEYSESLSGLQVGKRECLLSDCCKQKVSSHLISYIVFFFHTVDLRYQKNHLKSKRKFFVSMSLRQAFEAHLQASDEELSSGKESIIGLSASRNKQVLVSYKKVSSRTSSQNHQIPLLSGYSSFQAGIPHGARIVISSP
ncbi:hypothetical protein VP01_83g4 [Puccinia sorghi]|uniref:Uncharacterized protein n=1 Tax=Puccinia sorghi TaxID=27349 RepID=A0A0L6U9J6_9BASI|nr:hypothetical protein VP01_83g4 [Puccinia sorghi]